jgi:hypothetical protein
MFKIEPLKDNEKDRLDRNTEKFPFKFTGAIKKNNPNVDENIFENTEVYK